MAKEEMMMDWGKHKKMMGAKLLILGILILGNVYWPMLTWPAFIGWIAVITGFLKLVMMPMKMKK